jgi:GNAT superfamily N-acetyltransferase
VYATDEITRADAKSGFCCGAAAQDHYFRQLAVRNHEAGSGRCFVLRRSAVDRFDLPLVLGFYTLSMASVESSLVSHLLPKKPPRYPMPVALIGQLAVDERAQRMGVGVRLIEDAARRISAASELLGCIGIIVDADNERAVQLYAKFDFVFIGDKTEFPRRMFVSLVGL